MRRSAGLLILLKATTRRRASTTCRSTGFSLSRRNSFCSGGSQSSLLTRQLQERERDMTREEELRELASNLQAAIAKARQLDLPTSVYILSMALVEVSQRIEAELRGQADPE